MPIYFELGSGREADGEIITFQGTYFDKPVLDSITREAVEELWGSDPLTDNWVDMFAVLEKQVFDLTGAKIRRGMVEPDGSVVVRIGDRQLLQASG
ncbi:hypothetical protein ACFB49_33010 [Sphingomonas sp. DBB INV C78]|uniref:hypothetical protein n=1 Tax=Sphingomonas sp. DBB INV C78 TaxID=3349434 RepID=UPI0036D3A6F7